MQIVEPHLWWLCAFICSLLGACFFTANQYLKLDGNQLIFWRGLVPFCVLTPLLFFIEWPVSPVFYGATFMTAFIASRTDVMQVQGAAQFGGGLTARMKPFSVWLLFLLWFAVDEGHRELLLSDLPRFYGIVFTLVVGVLAATHIRKCAVSRAAFIYFIPVIICEVIISFFNKTAMDHSPFWGGVIVYAWIQGGIITMLCFCRHIKGEGRFIGHLFARKMLSAGVFLGVCAVGMGLTKNAAMSFANNPAYVTAIIFTAPFWIALYYRLTGHKEEGDVRAGSLLVLSAITLVLLNS